MASSTLTAGRGVTSGPTADWSTPNNITACNNSYATVGLTFGAAAVNISDFLRADQFGFQIPLGSTINGIVCTVQRKAGSASTIRDYAVNILKNGSIPAGSDNKANTGVYWSTTEGDVSYGSPTDLWNTTWGALEINSSTSGFAVRCQYIPGYGTDTAYVDCMSMTVYYTTDGGLKIGTTSVVDIMGGATGIKAVYYGTTQLT